MRQILKRESSVTGFSLVEVLVTLVVLSVALLGLAFTQAQSSKINHGAYSRTQASVLAYDIIDLMRANGRLSDFVSQNALADADDCTWGENLGGVANIQNELNCWHERLNFSLVDANADISIDPGPDSRTAIVAVTLQWNEQQLRSVDSTASTTPDPAASGGDESLIQRRQIWRVRLANQDS